MDTMRVYFTFGAATFREGVDTRWVSRTTFVTPSRKVQTRPQLKVHPYDARLPN